MSIALDLCSTVPAGAQRGQLLGLVTSGSRVRRWRGLPTGLDAMLDGYERFQMGALIARLLGADEGVVDGLQQRQGEEVVHALLGRLPPGLRGALQRGLAEEYGLLHLHHTTVRELARRAEESSDVFAASAACHLATIGLDGQIRRVYASPDAPRLLVDVRDTLVGEVLRRAPVEAVPLQQLGVAMLWFAMIARLGREPLEDETTEHYAA